jgi:hypothetical protein
MHLGQLMPIRSAIRIVAVIALLVTALPAQESPNGTAANSRDHENGITLVEDGFDGSGSLLDRQITEDLDGGGWQITDLTNQPRRSNGRLVSGGAGSLGSIMLPPLSPHGEVTITAALVVRKGPGLMLGFTDTVHPLTAGEAGPLVQVSGDGRVAVLQDRTTTLGEGTIESPWSAQEPVTLFIRYRLWDKTMVVSANGRYLLQVAMKAIPTIPHRCFAIAFAGVDADTGPALDALHITYLPLHRPVPMVPQRTVEVQDTTLAGINKAITDANATSGPDHIVEISIPTGDYHFTPSEHTKEHLFRLFGLHHLIINWNQSTITIHDPTLGLHNLSAGRNVTVKNIAAVDFPDDNLPFTQGTVRAFDPASRSFDLEIDAGYPLPTNGFFARARAGESWGQLIDAKNPGRRQPGAVMEYWITDVQPVMGRVFRYVLKTALNGFAIGSRFADCPRTGNALFRLFDAKDVRLENITGHSSPHFWSMVYNSTVSYDRVRVLLKPGRLMTANGDLVTGTGNKLWLDHCEFEGNADDICHQFRGEATYIANTIFRNNRRFGVWFNTGEFGVVTNCQFDGIGSFALTGMKEPEMDENLRFATRNVLCVGNRFQNLSTDAIVIHSMHTREDSSPHWNTYWRLARNVSSAPFRIRNATDVRCVANSNGTDGQATINVDPAKTVGVVVYDNLNRRTFPPDPPTK